MVKKNKTKKKLDGLKLIQLTVVSLAYLYYDDDDIIILLQQCMSCHVMSCHVIIRYMYSRTILVPDTYGSYPYHTSPPSRFFSFIHFFLSSVELSYVVRYSSYVIRVMLLHKCDRYVSFVVVVGSTTYRGRGFLLSLGARRGESHLTSHHITALFARWRPVPSPSRR